MSYIDRYLENQQEEVRFRAIFNRNVSDSEWAKVGWVKELNSYGRHTNNLEECEQLLQIHQQIDDAFASKLSIIIDEQDIIKFVVDMYLKNK